MLSKLFIFIIFLLSSSLFFASFFLTFFTITLEPGPNILIHLFLTCSVNFNLIYICYLLFSLLFFYFALSTLFNKKQLIKHFYFFYLKIG
jgi:hypothetical protein